MPSVVAMAVRMEMAIWMMVCHVFFEVSFIVSDYFYD